MMKVVIYVACYDVNNVIKFREKTGITIDVFPEVQKNIYSYRQNALNQSESGGFLLGYENAKTKNFTISMTTIPQKEDVSSRCSLKLSSIHYNQTFFLKKPYGYVGTWHTHPTAVPNPSLTDLKDWKDCIKANKNKTNNLIFIIAGTKEFSVWIANCKTGVIIEGDVINEGN